MVVNHDASKPIGLPTTGNRYQEDSVVVNYMNGYKLQG